MADAKMRERSSGSWSLARGRRLPTDYQNRAVAAAQVIEELIAMARDLREADRRQPRTWGSARRRWRSTTRWRRTTVRLPGSWRSLGSGEPPQLQSSTSGSPSPCALDGYYDTWGYARHPNSHGGCPSLARSRPAVAGIVQAPLAQLPGGRGAPSCDAITPFVFNDLDVRDSLNRDSRNCGLTATVLAPSSRDFRGRGAGP